VLLHLLLASCDVQATTRTISKTPSIPRLRLARCPITMRRTWRRP